MQVLCILQNRSIDIYVVISSMNKNNLKLKCFFLQAILNWLFTKALILKGLYIRNESADHMRVCKFKYVRYNMSVMRWNILGMERS